MRGASTVPKSRALSPRGVNLNLNQRVYVKEESGYEPDLYYVNLTERVNEVKVVRRGPAGSLEVFMRSMAFHGVLLDHVSLRHIISDITHHRAEVRSQWLAH